MMVLLTCKMSLLWMSMVCSAIAMLTLRNCDVTISAVNSAIKNGTFRSPRFPETYPNDVHCIYKFICKADMRVRIRFTFFALQGRYPICESDYVDVYAQLQDQHEDLLDAKMTGRFCGSGMNDLPQLMVSTSNILVLSFFTDSSKVNQGFHGTYEFFSDDVYNVGTHSPPNGYTIRSTNKPSGYLVSPTYPGMYPDNTYCFYKLEGRPGQRIRITFEDFALFYGGEYCPFDYLKIYDGLTNKDPEIGIFCGRYNDTTTIFSTKEVIFLEFVTGQGRLQFNRPPLEREADFSYERKGFNITYYFSDKFVNLKFITEESEHVLGTECDQRILSHKESNGTIFSPGYPGNFQEGVVCNYYLDGLMDRQNLEKVAVSFTDFYIPGSMPYCALGFVGQLHATLISWNDLQERFCGSINPPRLISDGPRMVLILNTQNAVSGGKFVAKYSFVTDYGIDAVSIEEGKCKYYYRSDKLTSGHLNSPRFPGKYPFSMYCEYVFQPAMREVLILNFEVLLFPETQASNDNCQHADYIEVMERIGGRQNNFTLTETYCEHGIVPGPYVTQNVVKIIFRSDHHESSVGFKASFNFVHYQELMKRCGPHTIHAQGLGGKITSPQFPQKYSALTWCEWTLQASRKSHRILVQFTSLSMEGLQNNCQHAVLKVYSDGASVTPIAFLCGKSSEPVSFVSKSDTLSLRFISSPASLGAKGFSISWTELLSADDQTCSHFFCSRNNYCISETLKCDGQPNCGSHDDSDETVECPQTSHVKILHIAIGASISSFFLVVFVICAFYHRRKGRLGGNNRRHSECDASTHHGHVEVRYVSSPSGCNTTDRLMTEECEKERRSNTVKLSSVVDGNTTTKENCDGQLNQKISMV